MADLGGLKKRVELIDLRLRTAHSARERESAALVEIWEQIRERFLEQNAEILRLRDRVTELEDTRDELLRMVHGLLSSIEGGLERMSDETVPQIKAMASSLLDSGSEPSGHRTGGDSPSAECRSDPSAQHAIWDDEPDEPNFHSDLLNAIQRSIDDADQEELDVYGSGQDRPQRSVGEPASPGIRDLIARIEDAVSPALGETSPPSDADDGPDDELSRDLREIEALRGELHGLRERMSSAGR